MNGCVDLALAWGARPIYNITKLTAKQQGTIAVTHQYDAIVIGAGVSGLYALYKLRESASRHGFSKPALISAARGTGIATRAPVSILRAYTYQYSFSPELLDEWKWSEHFSGQPEIERYLHFVADKFDLKRDIECNARVATVITTRLRSSGN
jgi:cation diffusion facilitator CzcD-associated flavoprotein CzcO